MSLLLYAQDSLDGRFTEGLRQGLQLAHSSIVLEVMLRTLRLALVATTIGTLVGLPFGCLLGLGRSAKSRILLGVANTLTRVPPVAAGLLVLLLLTKESPWGGGPLAGLDWYYRPESGYFAQTLLAIPIVTALTASAVQGVPAVLIEQARAYGATRAGCGMLALREARRAAFAGVIVAMGVTITAVGALAVTNSGNVTRAGAPTTLALGALQAFQNKQYGVPPSDSPFYPTDSLAVAYSIVLLGLFVLVAAALTFLQEKRASTWIPGLT